MHVFGSTWHPLYSSPTSSSPIHLLKEGVNQRVPRVSSNGELRPQVCELDIRQLLDSLEYGTLKLCKTKTDRVVNDIELCDAELVEWAKIYEIFEFKDRC